MTRYHIDPDQMDSFPDWWFKTNPTAQGPTPQPEFAQPGDSGFGQPDLAPNGFYYGTRLNSLWDDPEDDDE